MDTPFLEVPMGIGVMPLTEKQAKSIHALYIGGHWPALELILSFIQEATAVALRDPSATLDEIRVHQGRIQGVQLVAQTVVEEVSGYFSRQVTTE